MASRRPLALGMGTLVLVTTMWFGLLTGRTAPLMAAVIIGVGIVFAMYAVAGFSGQDDPFTAGFKGSLYAMVVGIGLLIAYRTTGNASFVLVAPVVAAGVGGSVALAPSNVRSQVTARQVAAVVAGLAMSWLFRVDDVLYALFSPIVALPVLALADRFHERGRGIVEEATDPNATGR